VVWLERYGVWAMARYAEVHEALRDWSTFCSSAGVGLSGFRRETPWRPPSLLLQADPPALPGRVTPGRGGRRGLEPWPGAAGWRPGRAVSQQRQLAPWTGTVDWHRGLAPMGWPQWAGTGLARR
jgi:hypothetical protein